MGTCGLHLQTCQCFLHLPIHHHHDLLLQLGVMLVLALVSSLACALVESIALLLLVEHLPGLLCIRITLRVFIVLLELATTLGAILLLVILLLLGRWLLHSLELSNELHLPTNGCQVFVQVAHIPMHLIACHSQLWLIMLQQ